MSEAPTRGMIQRFNRYVAVPVGWDENGPTSAVLDRTTDRIVKSKLPTDEAEAIALSWSRGEGKPA